MEHEFGDVAKGVCRREGIFRAGAQPGVGGAAEAGDGAVAGGGRAGLSEWDMNLTRDHGQLGVGGVQLGIFNCTVRGTNCSWQGTERHDDDAGNGPSWAGPKRSSLRALVGYLFHTHDNRFTPARPPPRLALSIIHLTTNHQPPSFPTSDR